MAMEIDSNLNISLTRGDTGRIKVACTVKETGEAYSIGSKDTLVLTVKSNTSDSEPLFQKTVKGSDIITIAPTDTSSLAYGKYRYDIQLTTSDGEVCTITGLKPPKFTIAEEVTW